MAEPRGGTFMVEKVEEAQSAETPDAPLLDLNNAAVKKFIKAGKVRGWVTVDELNKILPSEDFTSEQIEDVMSQLSEMGVNLIEAEEDGQEEGGEVATVSSSSSAVVIQTGNTKEGQDRTDDPVRMYLREMGAVELLSREGEIAIAKRIEAGRDAMIRGLCESPLTFEAIMVWRDELQTGRRPMVQKTRQDLEADSVPAAGRQVVVQRNGNVAVDKVLALEFELHLGVGGQVDDFERVLFFVTPARVGVELGVDEFLDGGAAVAGDGDQLAACCGDHLAAHHQQAVLVARDEALHHHVAALGVGHVVGRFDVFLLAQVQRHAPAVVAVGGLDHHGQADVLCGLPGFLGAVDDLAFGDGHAAGLEQALGQILVAGNAFSNRAGVLGLGGPDAALAGAVAQLHQVAVGQADRWNLAVGGGVDDVGRARAQ
eukprot:gene14792-19877_t